MKTTIKRLSAILLIAVMLSVIALPAKAWYTDAYAHSAWTSRFPTRSTANASTKYESVMLIQRFMDLKNFGNLVIDGYYGTNTSKAVLAFQKSRGIGQDGKVGPVTWQNMQQLCGAYGKYSNYYAWSCISPVGTIIARHYSDGTWYYGNGTTYRII